MDSVEVQEKKKKIVVLCSRPPENVKLGTFTSLSCSDGRETYKKACFFANFLPFSLPSPSSLPKFPDIIVLELPWTQRLARNAF